MCGIVGIWNFDKSPIDAAMLDCFTDTLAHRGPDGRGTHIDAESRVGLGHRRLAILDLTPTGRQPMSFADGRYWITFNGEIYNFIELRAELEKKGHRFRTESDTEVILAAYHEWGEDCQLRFNGMWAFAIWDSREKVLFLSRDRFGIKPMHYYRNDRYFAFASEMKAFLALDWFGGEFDPVIVVSEFQNPDDLEGTEDCLLKGIKRLQGGRCLTVGGDGAPRLRRWWNTLEHLEEVPAAFDQQVERYRELFFDSCRIRMRSDVPISTSLSGGTDSSSVLCTMTKIRKASSTGERQAEDWQRAFIATYPDTIFDERRYADAVVDHTGAIPVYNELNYAKMLDYLDDIIFQAEEIFYDIVVGPWSIYRLQRANDVCVSMDGHGGDETLAGYYHYVFYAMKDALWPIPDIRRLRELRSILNGLFPSGYPNVPTMKDLWRQQYLWPAKKAMRRRVLEFLSRFSPAYAITRSLYRSAQSARWYKIQPRIPRFTNMEEDRAALSKYGSLFKILYEEFHATRLPTILRNFERASMAHGVEVRTPFLDWRLVCYAFSLPAKMIYGNGFNRLVLREALRGVLPELIRTRTDKIGFINPLNEWLVSQEVRAFMLDIVGSAGMRQSEIWDASIIRDDVEKAYASGNLHVLKKTLKVIQAVRIKELFKDHQRRAVGKL
jgi:asparagine synthase (glutamine-hydrolysing)